MRKVILIISIITTLYSCIEKEKQQKELKLSDFEFNSIFGTNASEPNSTYCILGTGFFRTPRSENSDKLIENWLKQHPNAIVVPVSSFGPTESDIPESKMVYCLIIDQKDTLNNYIIKEGCFPGGTMIRPRTWDEMEEWEKELYEDSDEKIDIQILIDKKVYDTFIEQIKVAELFAQENKLGIWEENNTEKE